MEVGGGAAVGINTHPGRSLAANSVHGSIQESAGWSEQLVRSRGVLLLPVYPTKIWPRRAMRNGCSRLDGLLQTRFRMRRGTGAKLLEPLTGASCRQGTGQPGHRQVLRHPGSLGLRNDSAARQGHFYRTPSPWTNTSTVRRRHLVGFPVRPRRRWCGDAAK